MLPSTTNIAVYTNPEKAPSSVAYVPSKAFVSSTLVAYKCSLAFYRSFVSWSRSFSGMEWHESIAKFLSYVVFSLAEWRTTLFFSEDEKKTNFDQNRELSFCSP